MAQFVLTGIFGLLTVIVGGISSQEVSSQMRMGNSTKFNYDMLVLVNMWAPSFCQKLPCDIPYDGPKWWTLHGLWPSETGEKDKPHTCNPKAKYSVTSMKPIREKMNTVWRSYKANGTNDAFWAHEYMIHGTCAADLPSFDSQLKFFNKTMSLYHEYNITKILEDGNVTPGSKQNYTLGNVTSALSAGLGVEPAVFCMEKKHFQYLLEIRTCFTRDLSPFTCGSNLTGGGRCNPKKEILYPPFPSTYSRTTSITFGFGNLIATFLLFLVVT